MNSVNRHVVHVSTAIFPREEIHVRILTEATQSAHLPFAAIVIDSDDQLLVDRVGRLLYRHMLGFLTSPVRREQEAARLAAFVTEVELLGDRFAHCELERFRCVVEGLGCVLF
jgi:hypothetical protein